jgi:hypothetical protein
MKRGVLFLALGVLFSPSLFASDNFNSKYTIVCSSADCPPYVGAFISQQDTMVEKPEEANLNILCSATLISDNQIITNKHCLPESLHQMGAECSNKSQIVFPETKDYQAESHSCSKIKAIGNTDWAVVEFHQKTQRPAVTLSSESVAFQEKIHGYPVYYNDFFPLGEIKSVTCDVSQLGYMDFHTFHESSRDIFATNCTEAIRIGNSGTSFYDKNENFVVLLKEASHHSFVTPADVVQNGSTSLRGTKTKCIPFEKNIPSICSWSDEDPQFQGAAIEYSTLLEFKAKRPKAETTPFSSYIQWGKSTAKNTIPVFQKLYAYSTLSAALQFFELNGETHVARELETFATEVLEWSPVCVRGTFAKVQDTFTYAVLNYHDYEIFPDEKGNSYLSVGEDLQLKLHVQRIELPVEIEYTRTTNTYRISYLKTTDPFKFTSEEEHAYTNECLKEKELKKQQCERAKCDLSAQQLLTASVKCQKLFKKKSFSHYLVPFSFELPACK